jgi:hypothetical protein
VNQGAFKIAGVEKKRAAFMKKLTLIITCEECGHVQHLEAKNEREIESLVSAFRCPGRCRSTHHSYISIGEISYNTVHAPQLMAV